MSGILAVTGITGKSGRFFARELDKNSGPVSSTFSGIRALVRESSDTAWLDSLEIEIEKNAGRLDDFDYMKKALSGVDTLVHIAGIYCTRDVMRAATECHVRRIIAVHTTGVYSKYKAAGEEYRKIDAELATLCENAGIALTILRPTMIYGTVNDNNVIVFIKMVDRLPIMPVVNQARYALQPVHCADLGKAYFQVLFSEETTAGRNFDLSGGAPITLRDMLTEIGKNLGKRVKFFSVPFPIAYAGAWAVYAATFGCRDYREKVQRLCEPRVYSHADAESCFGYAPLSFEQGIAEEVRMYKEMRDRV